MVVEVAEHDARLIIEAAVAVSACSASLDRECSGEAGLLGGQACWRTYNTYAVSRKNLPVVDIIGIDRRDACD